MKQNIRAAHLTWNEALAFMRQEEEKNKKDWQALKKRREQALHLAHQERKVEVEATGQTYSGKERTATEKKFYGALKTDLYKRCREHCVNKNSLFLQRFPWLLEVHCDIRENVVIDLKKAREALQALHTKFNKDHQSKILAGTCKQKTFSWKQINFRKWTDYKSNIVIKKKHASCKKGKIAHLISPEYCYVRVPQRAPQKEYYSLQAVTSQFRISLNRRGQVHAFIPIPLETVSSLDGVNISNVASIDPGVRSFITVFSALDGSITDWCPGDATKMYQKLLCIDKLKSKREKLQQAHKQRSPEEKKALKGQWKLLRERRKKKKLKKRSRMARCKKRKKMEARRKVKQEQFKRFLEASAKGELKDGDHKPIKQKAQVGPRTRWRLKRAIMRQQEKVKNMVTEVHRKAAKWLLESFDCILLPAFQSKNMSQKKQEHGHKKRKLGRKTVRRMLNWCHYSFRQFLLHKVKEYPGKKVIVCDEAYTSKCCGQCGTLNQKLGSSKNFNCSNCNYKADRDDNGARNVLLRHLTKLKQPHLFR